MNTYFRILGFGKPIEKYAIPYFFYVLFHSIFNTFNFVLIIPILNTLFDGEKAKHLVTQMPDFAMSTQYMQDMINYILFKNYGANYDVMDVLLVLSVFIVVSVLISNSFRYMAQRTMENMRIATLFKLRNTVFNHVMDLSASFFSNERKGDIIAKITSDVQVVQFCITSTLQVVFREPFLLAAYLFVLVKISWELTIFTAIFLPLTAFSIGFIVKRLRKSAREGQEAFGEMSSTLDESLTGIKIVKSYNATTYIKEKFRLINLKMSDIARYMSRRQQLASPISEFLGVSAIAVILMFGGSLVLNGRLNAADFMAYIAIFSQITRPVRAIADSFSSINQGIAAGDRVLGLLDTPNPVQDSPDAVDLVEFKDEIEFRNIRFAYESREVISGISFKIKKGQTIALVGPSGGGKSTLTDLLPRFYDVSDGEIIIDGVNIKNYTQESLRSHMGMVAQETILFNDTIESNIRLGKREATMTEIEDAAKVANAHNFILETENGYQTNIGERGNKLSGGQRQRLSISRAVLKNPSILILDEATSALDTESEKMVQGALESLLEGRTSVVVAHRLSTIYNADHIYVIDQGRVAEHGTHNELIALGGIYSKLIEMQQFS